MPTRLSQKFASMGSFGGDIIIDFEPDPDIIAQAYIRVADYLDDIVKPLLAAKAIARADMQHHFDTETGPDGTHWQELDEDYAQYKSSKGFPPDILHRYGTLESAAVDDSAWTLANDTLYFTTSSLPFYWWFHQRGTDDGEWAGKAGEYRAATKFARETGSTTAESGGTRESYGIGTGKALPARPFVGLSEGAQLQIIEVFDMWFDEAVPIFVGATGVVQERNRGHFGAKLFPDVGGLG
jgi:phage gpG-like protein